MAAICYTDRLDLDYCSFSWLGAVGLRRLGLRQAVG
jgi:hypothetical protein